MSRYTKQTVSSIAGINSELTKIQTAISDSLSRKGDTPNQMVGTLDMNSNRILNLPEPVADHEPLTKGLGDGILEGAQAARDQAEMFADQAANSAGMVFTYDASRSEVDVTVRIPSDYPTLQAAIDDIHGRLFPAASITVDLLIESGHQPSSGVSVSNGNYSYFKISSEDPIVTLAPGFDGSAGAVLNAEENSVSPVLNCLIDINAQGLEPRTSTV